MESNASMLLQQEQERMRQQGQALIERLRERNIQGFYCDSAREAVERVCSLIPSCATVAMGGSFTIQQMDLLPALRSMDIHLVDRYREGITREEVDDMRHQGLHSDVFIASCNAVTEDGRLVSMDGTGNRVASIIFGPRRVILVVGMQKLVPTLDDAIRRIRERCAPQNAQRLGIPAICAQEGICDQARCHPPDRLCGQLTVIESVPIQDRITVVLVGEELGY